MSNKEPECPTGLCYTVRSLLKLAKFQTTSFLLRHVQMRDRQARTRKLLSIFPNEQKTTKKMKSLETTNKPFREAH